jgi:hypothetical protein
MQSVLLKRRRHSSSEMFCGISDAPPKSLAGGIFSIEYQ